MADEKKGGGFMSKVKFYLMWMIFGLVGSFIGSSLLVTFLSEKDISLELWKKYMTDGNTYLLTFIVFGLAFLFII